MSLRSWISDYLHERHVRYLRRRVRVALDGGERELAVIRWTEMLAAINARSPEQVQRLEKRMGIRS